MNCRKIWELSLLYKFASKPDEELGNRCNVAEHAICNFFSDK